MSELRPGDRLDQCLLDDIIARSGMATIFRARDNESGHMVALKVPYLQYESDIVFHERFLREEQIGLRLRHPAIIQVFRPKEKSRVYLAMEYIEGELLSVRLHREGRLPIADALVYLHSQNVVHRDLKPENIMILPDGKLKLMDFGIALDTSLRKITWSGLSQTMGTPDYMAPEQVKGRRGDAHTDIYSLGVILYDMLTGQVPFTGENVYAAMRAKVHEDPLPPRKLRPDLSPHLEEIILHALERAPKDRFESAGAFLEALTHPEEVTLTDRAARQRPKSKGIPWLRTLLIFITGKRQ